MAQGETNERQRLPGSGDFDAFLSYSSEDRVAVQELKHLLEARKLRIWMDQEQLIPGRPWIPELQKALRQTGSVVVAIGSSGIGPWQSAEVQVALNNAVRLQRPAIPVLLPGSSPQNKVDEFLQSLTWVDLHKGYFSDGIDRLVWGIKGHKPESVSRTEITQNLAATSWILVAGSGGIRSVPANVKAASERLGTALAVAGFSLVTGGWNGVDEFVARAFAERIQEFDQPLSGRLVQVMQKGELPHFPAGRLDSGGSEDESWRRSIERADAVVLVGGVGGTRQTGEIAKQLGKFVFPLADTRASNGGHHDAYDFYFATLKNWSSNPLSHFLTEDEFHSLGNAAPGVVSDLVRLLKQVLMKS